MKYTLYALALAALVAPSAALAFCNGVGNSCSYSQTSSYSQPYTYSQYQSPYTYQQPSYGSYGYQQSQPIYFPVSNITFPNYMPQQSYGGYNSYGYRQMPQSYNSYGYSSYSYYQPQQSWSSYYYGY